MTSHRSAAPLALLLLAAACGGGTSPTTDPPVQPADAWATVDSLIRSSVSANSIPGLGVAIYDANDRLVFRRMYGDFAPDRRVAVASSSKWISGMVILEQVAEGRLSLSSTTGTVLGWTGPQAAITLEQLLSFTSGMAPDANCTGNALLTLAQCVEQIRSVPLLAAPGTRYDYGSTHLHVAARMAEVVTGRTWNQLFRETLGAPLGLDAAAQYYTAPRQLLGTINPLVAGGLRTSMDEYAKLLAVAFHKGSYAGLSIATPALFDAQRREPFPTVTIGSSPMAEVGYPYRYGLAAWLECSTPATGCATISSAGAFGWVPWIDLTAGYYAIIGTEYASQTGGVVAASVRLEQALQPAIRTALAATP